MKFRLSEGGGRCLYEVGVLDNGHPEGLPAGEMAETLHTLRSMAATLGAEVRVLKQGGGVRGEVAEVEVVASPPPPWTDVRVAVIGSEQSGKSTLVGVLCTGKRDNGRGSARMNVFRHRHEVETGCTSSLSSQLLGFSAAGEVLNGSRVGSPSPSAFSSHSWSSITDVACKIVTFSDLSGAESGQKVTLPSLLHDAVDYALVVVSAQHGLTPHTRHCIDTCTALTILFLVVITQCDVVPHDRVQQVMGEVEEMVTAPGVDRTLVQVTTKGEGGGMRVPPPSPTLVPLFILSSVTGLHVDVFTSYLSTLTPHRDWGGPLLPLPFAFSIDSIYSIDCTSIVGGLCTQGSLTLPSPTSPTTLLLGPIGTAGTFHPVQVTSIHIKRRDVRRVQAGQAASLGLSLPPSLTHSHLRRGQWLFDPSHPSLPSPCLTFDALLHLSSPPDPLLLYYQPVLYMPNIRQAATLISFHPEGGAGDGAGVGKAAAGAGGGEGGGEGGGGVGERRYLMRFRWCYFPEIVKEGDRVVLREGQTRGMGRVVKVWPMAEEKEEEKGTETGGGRRGGGGRRDSHGGACAVKRRKDKGGKNKKRRASAAEGEVGVVIIDSPVSSDPSSPLPPPSHAPYPPLASAMPHSASLPHLRPHASRSLIDTAPRPDPSPPTNPALLRTLSPILQLMQDGSSPTHPTPRPPPPPRKGE